MRPNIHTIKPVVIDQATLAFPANVYELGLVPHHEDLPPEWMRFYSRTPWGDIANRWFASLIAGGIPQGVEMHLKEGIDGETLVRHLTAIGGSYAIPKHQYKIAAIAWLLKLWCHKIRWPAEGNLPEIIAENATSTEE